MRSLDSNNTHASYRVMIRQNIVLAVAIGVVSAGAEQQQSASLHFD
jgi:hypothetical protein